MTPAAPAPITAADSDRMAAKPGAETPTTTGNSALDYPNGDLQGLGVVALRRLAELTEDRDSVDAGLGIEVDQASSDAWSTAPSSANEVGAIA